MPRHEIGSWGHVDRGRERPHHDPGVPGANKVKDAK
jgi:hypothetical protein